MARRGCSKSKMTTFGKVLVSSWSPPLFIVAWVLSYYAPLHNYHSHEAKSA